MCGCFPILLRRSLSDTALVKYRILARTCASLAPVCNLRWARRPATVPAVPAGSAVVAYGGSRLGQPTMYYLFVSIMHLVVVEGHLADGCGCSQRAALLYALTIRCLAAYIHIHLVVQRCACWQRTLLLLLWSYWHLPAVGCACMLDLVAQRGGGGG
jgi:hypothetical protein